MRMALCVALACAAAGVSGLLVSARTGSLVGFFALAAIAFAKFVTDVRRDVRGPKKDG